MPRAWKGDGLTRHNPSMVIYIFGPVTLISADQALNDAALAEGLAKPWSGSP
jgi:hypothetical protein